MNRRRALAIALLMTAPLLAPSTAQAVIFGPPPPAFLHIKPCRYEDSPGPCIWEATKRGDRAGLSFWVDYRGEVHYFR